MASACASGSPKVLSAMAHARPDRITTFRVFGAFGKVGPEVGPSRCPGGRRRRPRRGAPAASPLHREARAPASRDSALRGRGASPARGRVGGRALVSQRCVHPHGRAGPARPQVPARAGRARARPPRRRGADRGALALRPGRGWPPGSARTSASPRHRSGASEPRARSSVSSRPPSVAKRSPRWASQSPEPARTWPDYGPPHAGSTAGTSSTGSKTLITNGVRADFVVTAVKTTEEGGHQGLSFLIVERESEGFEVSKKLEKLGWHASDTGDLSFSDVFVPEDNLLGEQNRGFYRLPLWERVRGRFANETLTARLFAVRREPTRHPDAARNRRPRAAASRRRSGRASARGRGRGQRARVRLDPVQDRYQRTDRLPVRAGDGG